MDFSIGGFGLIVRLIIPFETALVRGVYCSISPEIRLLFAMLLKVFRVVLATFLGVL
jgi:hypothetical protein